MRTGSDEPLIEGVPAHSAAALRAIEASRIVNVTAGSFVQVDTQLIVAVVWYGWIVNCENYTCCVVVGSKSRIVKSAGINSADRLDGSRRIC